MNSVQSSLGWAMTLQYVIAGLFLLTQCTALVFCLLRWRLYPRPSLFLFLSIVVAMGTRLATIGGHLAISRLFSPAEFAQYAIALNAISHLAALLAFVLVFVAVYIDRDRPMVKNGKEEFTGESRSGEPLPRSSNPYLSPEER